MIPRQPPTITTVVSGTGRRLAVSQQPQSSAMTSVGEPRRRLGRLSAVALAFATACAPTLADLRDSAADMRPEDVLRLAGEAFDAWHAARLAAADTDGDVDALADADARWHVAYATAVRAVRLYRADPASQADRWATARDALLGVLRDVGALP